MVNDVAILSKWWADGKVMAHAGFPNGLETDELQLANRIKFQNEKVLPKNLLMIIELSNQYPIGEMNYREISAGVFEIGIKICVFEEQSKGYGAKAINLLIKYLKKELNANKIVLDTNLNNVRAQNFYKRLGFKQVEVIRDSWKDQLGKLQSAVVFEMELK